MLHNVHHTRPLSSLKKSVTSNKKVMKHCTRLGKGPILGMTPAQALTAIQTMADHSQKWHDGSSSRNIDNDSNFEGIAAIVNKLDSLAHLDKECLLNEEVKSVEEVKYGEFGRSSPFNNGAKYRVGPSGYYTRVDNRLPFREKKHSLEELLNKHIRESTQIRSEMEEWVAQEEDDMPSRVLPCQLPPKELNPESFTFPCTIGNFVVIDMLKTHNETMIFGRPFLATIHAEIDIFNKEISLGMVDDMVTFDMDKRIHNFTTPVGKVYMVNSILNDEPSTSSNAPGYKFAQDTLVKSSSLAIIIRITEKCSGESLVKDSMDDDDDVLDVLRLD
ncbi:hypothetical protein Tco_0648512 [Tanacetum coccineum]